MTTRQRAMLKFVVAAWERDGKAPVFSDVMRAAGDYPAKDTHIQRACKSATLLQSAGLLDPSIGIAWGLVPTEAGWRAVNGGGAA